MIAGLKMIQNHLSMRSRQRRKTGEGIHFLQLSDGFFIANVGDWTPVTYVGHITIPLPLPASFVYYDYPGGEDAEIGTEEDLLADLQDSSPSFFNPYNTSIFLRNGELLELHNWSYPWGPQLRRIGSLNSIRSRQGLLRFHCTNQHNSSVQNQK